MNQEDLGPLSDQMECCFSWIPWSTNEVADQMKICANVPSNYWGLA